jgi:malic enzyme
MMKAASLAIASSIPNEELGIYNIIPNPLDPKVHERVASAVKAKAIETNVPKTHTKDKGPARLILFHLMRSYQRKTFSCLI